MNTIDLIVCLALALAVWNGWRQGFVVQICSLAGLVAGIWLAARYGEAAGHWLGLDASVAAAGGFAAVLVAVVIAVGIAARAARRLFRFAGFSVPDIVLGIAVSVLKYVLLIGVLFTAFDKLNEDRSLVGEQTLSQSRSYAPVMRLSRMVFPFLRQLGEQFPLPACDPAPEDTAPRTAPVRETDLQVADV